MSFSEGVITYHIDEESALIRVSICGPVTMPQIEQLMDCLTIDPNYRLEYDAYVDLREFTGTLDSSDIRRFAGLVIAYPGSTGARRAIVVRDDLQFGLMRMLEGFTFVAPVIYRAFRSPAAAQTWLKERCHVPTAELTD